MSTLDVGRLRAWLEIDKTKFDKTLREFEREMRDAEKDAAKRLDAIADSFAAMDRKAADSGENVGKSVKKMALSVEDAERRVRAAHEAVADAAEEMARAHTALDFERLVGDTDKIAAAEKRLDRALRDVAKSGREADHAMDGLAKAQKAAADAVGDDAGGSALGEKIGQRLRKAASSAITYTIPAMAAGGVQLGAAAGGGVVTGFGAGIIGLGIAAQKGNEQVEASFIGMSSRVAKRAQDISKPWIGTLLQISRVAEQTWHTLEDELKGALARLAPATGRFVTNTAKAVAQFGPALDPISRATEAVMDDLGGRLPRIVDGLADSLADLADSVERNPEALGDLVEGIGNVLEVGIELLDFLVEAKGKFDELNPALKATLAPWTALDDAWNMVNGTGDEVLTTLDDLGDVSHDAGAETEALKDAQKDAADAAKEHAEQLDDLVDQIDDLIGTNIDARKAMNSAKDDIAEYAKAVKEHGVKSQEAAEAQLDLEDSAFRAADAIRSEVLAQQAASGQARDLASANAAARDRLRELAAMTSGPARDALLRQADLLDRNLATLRAMDRQFNARVNVAFSQTGKAPAPGFNLPYMRNNARGGSVAPGEISNVAEEGPEILSSGGKRYLLNGAKPGYITPTTDLVMGGATGVSGWGKGAGQLVVKVVLPPPTGDPVVDALMDGMRDRIRVSYGGSAEAGLGSN